MGPGEAFNTLDISDGTLPLPSINSSSPFKILSSVMIEDGSTMAFLKFAFNAF